MKKWLLLFFLFVLPLGAFAQMVVQNATYPAGQSVNVSGPTTIRAEPGPGQAVVVTSGATVNYVATTTITLRPGFTAASGSYFHAYLGVSSGGNYVLTVINGSGGATGVAGGSVVAISANPPPGGQYFSTWIVDSGPGGVTDFSASNTTFTMGEGNSTVRATYTSTPPEVDTDGDGVSDTVEQNLGLNPSDPTDVNVNRYEYDRKDQLKKGPGNAANGSYTKDGEGNITQVR